MKTGTLVTIKPQWCERSELGKVFVIRTGDEGKARVDISPIDWQHGALVPMQTVKTDMLEPYNP